MKYLQFFLYFSFITLFSGASLGQNFPNDTLILKELDTQFYIQKASSFLDFTRAQSFNQIQKQKFIKSKKPLFDLQAKMWYQFYISPQIESKELILSAGYSDLTEIFVPFKKTYQKYIVGRHTKKRVKFGVFDKSYVVIPIDSINFNNPFYFNKVAISRTGEINQSSIGSVIISNNASLWKTKKDSLIGYSHTKLLFLVIFSIAMFIFLVNYIVTRDINFLNYSIYLLFTILIFITVIPFLVNFLTKINPLLIDAVVNSSVILTSICYFNFVIVFVEVKQKFPKIYPFVKLVINTSLVLGIFSFFQILIWPYFKYRFILLNSFDIAFLVISVFVFIYLIFKKLTLLDRIVLMGSFLLIVGQLLSFSTGEQLYFLFAVVLEIIAFSSVVSLKNKVTLTHNLKYEASLKEETLRTKNLQELDTLKSNFITNISHEFRTPLTIVLGYVSNLKKKFEESSLENQDLITIEKNSENLLGLVNQMLDLAKLEQGKLSINMQKSNLANYIKMLIKSFEYQAKEKKISLQFSTTLQDAILDFDAEKIRQIVSNLVSNAMKFTEENGKISIVLSEKGLAYQISVIDTGRGIPTKDIPKIFDRFYQIENNHFKISQGTGIGLALTKELVHLLDGSIHVTSSIGEGTQFEITLPLTREAYDKENLLLEKTHVDTPIYTPKSTKKLNEENAPTILVVEDNKDMLRYILSCVQHRFKTITASNGKKGFEKAISKTPDIVISDVMMPVMDGFELTQKLQQEIATNHIPIILLTSRAMREDKMEGIQSGADVYLTKPFQKEELLLRIDTLIKKRRILQERYQLGSMILKKKSNHELLEDKNVLFLNKAITEVHKHLEDASFNAKNLSQALALSESQLYRKLKAITNYSTAIFIRNIRLNRAKELLETTSKSVSEIAYEVGFNDPKWFSKVFKETFDKTPTSFRK